MGERHFLAFILQPIGLSKKPFYDVILHYKYYYIKKFGQIVTNWNWKKMKWKINVGFL